MSGPAPGAWRTDGMGHWRPPWIASAHVAALPPWHRALAPAGLVSTRRLWRSTSRASPPPRRTLSCLATCRWRCCAWSDSRSELGWQLGHGCLCLPVVLEQCVAGRSMGRCASCATAHAKHARLRRSLEAAQAATRFDPTRPKFWARMGDAHRALGQHACALLCYEQAAKLAPRDEEIQQRCGAVAADASTAPARMARPLALRCICGCCSSSARQTAAGPAPLLVVQEGCGRGGGGARRAAACG